jgi:phosphoribosylanthranilate isomerase
MAWNWGAAKSCGLKNPLVLAGGLTPANVAEAIAKAQPDAVDVSSGVESEPGRKDVDKVRSFIEAVRACLLTKECTQIF